MPIRCQWVNIKDPLYVAYHDQEWGVPIHDDQLLFEFLILEGAQAGLSWQTILHRRQGYRQAFDNFDPYKVAHYDERRVSQLLANPGIIRNRLKINAAIRNARVFLDVQQEFGSFDTYLWQFVNGKPIVNGWTFIHEIPSATDLSRRLSQALLERGFRFVGPTICYAYMQAVGLLNDHTTDCFRYQEILDMYA